MTCFLWRFVLLNVTPEMPQTPESDEISDERPFETPGNVDVALPTTVTDEGNRVKFIPQIDTIVLPFFKCLIITICYRLFVL